MNFGICMIFSTISFLIVAFYFTTTEGFIQKNYPHNSKPKLTYIGTRTEVGPRKSTKEFTATNYYTTQDAMTWTTAIDICDAIFGGNASLLAIETVEENNWLNDWLASRGIVAGIYWTSGLYDIYEGTWRWRDFPEVDFNAFTSWGPGQPNLINNRQRVVVNFLRNSSHWESTDDSASHRLICEVPVAGEPTIHQETHS